MSHFAPVAPIKLLEQLDQIQVLGDYNLLLAHDILEHRFEYRALFHNRPGHVILDNSAVELNAPLDFKELMEAAKCVTATVVAAPDILEDGATTLGKYIRFVEQRKEFVLSGGHAYDVMAIPQGTSWEEVIHCAFSMFKVKPPDMWGIPRHLVKNLGSRTEVVKALYPTAAVHLLGMSKDLNDDIAAARMLGVRGIDSANPLVLGYAGKHILDSYSHIPRDEVNYWKQTHLTHQVKLNLMHIRSKIATLN